MLEKKYDHKAVENGRYQYWLDKKLFESGNKAKEPFCIVIPPPNVTGKLHLGHAWDTSLQDIVIRYKKLQGFDALWLPGMDHAGIATQAKVDQMLKDKGIVPRDMDREDWLEYAWAWKKEYSENIRKQWAKLGLTLDYTKERFTMDSVLSDAVNKVFIDYYNKGIIYRGERAINWDTELMTALSNIEVEYKEEKGIMYYFKYMFPDSNEYIEVATTRPETLASDTAVVVHPNDKRYKDLVGKYLITPLRKEAIPVITDEYIDMSFGSGVMKCSAHAAVDVDILKANNIEVRESINPDGRLNSNALEFEGMTREEGRKAIVEKLRREGLLIKEEEHIHQVGHSERSGSVIETMVMPQWFVSMEKLSKQVLDNQKTDSKVNFVPKRFEKILNNWMESAYDWCISRQLWWGHRIPAWYNQDKIYVGLERPDGEGWIQDSDVLDTWFSSALWPFATLGWPNETEDFKRYFPNNLLVTGYDIIFFWVSRMIFQSLELTSKEPFKEVLIHGLIRDKQGRKMSKSLGNGIDPMDMIELYGSDALRYYLTTSSAPGMDLRFDEDKMKSTWNFINKLWNASRFVLLNMEDFKEEDFTTENLSLEDKWILSRLNKTIKNVIKNMDKYLFNEAGNELYEFIWNDFCDNYIELSKFSLNENKTKSILLLILRNILQMLHPFMPFVTEEIYQKLPIKKESIMLSSYPVYDKKYIFETEEKEMETLITEITNIRNFKVDNNIPKECNIIISTKSEYETIFKNALKIKDNLLKFNNITSLEYTSPIIKITYSFEKQEEINLNDKLMEEKEILLNSINKRKNLLNNDNYINKAPKNIVDLDREKLKEEEERLKIIEEKLR